MSYVLDALRKSEQERQMAAGPAGCLLYPPSMTQPAARPGTGTLLGGAAAVALAALAFLLWRPSAMPPAAAPDTSAAAAVAMAAPGPMAMPDAAMPAATPTVPALPTLVSNGTAKDRAPERARPVAASFAKRMATPRLAAKRAALPAEARPAAAGQPPPRPEPGPVVLPEIRVAGYIRDENGVALAMIDDRLVREGDEVKPGLRLERILGDGSVFSYKGQRFRR